MARGMRAAIFAVIAVVPVFLAAFLLYRLSRPVEVMFVTGTVLRADPDVTKQRPIPNATVTVASGQTFAQGRSDAAGYFRLRLRPTVTADRILLLTVRHPHYEPVEISQPARDRIDVIRLNPNTPQSDGLLVKPTSTISNVRVRYALKSTSVVDVGSTVRTFEVANTGNIPCSGQSPCSPDGKWKATIGSVSLDAGAGRQFRNVRVSCTAGPCPFTRIEGDDYTRGGRGIKVSVRNWSDPVVYLLEAEVAQVMASEVVRHSYPAIFGRTMNFTLPPPAQGPSIEAEVDGMQIVFPLGPNLILSWANCRLETGADRTKLYRCELKPQYQFK